MRLKTEERRRAIIEAARGVFLERGYDAASMAEVSARVGGSKQTLYNYFSSKEDLFVAVVIAIAEPLFEPVFETLRARQDLPEALRDLAIGTVRAMCREEIIPYRRMVIAEGGKSNVGRLAYEKGPKRGWLELTEYFRQAMDEGRMRRADPWTAAMHFNGLCLAGPPERLLEGAVEDVSDEELVRSAEAGVEAFIRAYDVRS